MTLPSTPQTGTGLTDPLISPDDYARFTGDSASDSSDVALEIDDAIYAVSQHCERTIGHGQYEENLYIYSNGMVFPSATPIDRHQPVTVPGVTIYQPDTDVNPGSVLQGVGVWVGAFNPVQALPIFSGIMPPQTTVVYTGGYQPYGVTDGPTPGLPPELARAIASVAFYSLNPVSLSGMPVGVKSMSVGGVSISGDLSSFSVLDANTQRTLNRFRRPMAHAWGV